MAQIRLADIVGKTIQVCFVPADQKAVTFVLAEGRMSLGAPLVRLAGSGESQGAKVTGVTWALDIPKGDDPAAKYSELTLITNQGKVFVEWEGAAELVELPE